MFRHITMVLLAGLAGLAFYGCAQPAKQPGEMSVAGSADDPSGKLASTFDPGKPMSGSPCGNEDQCAVMETLDCDYTANCHIGIGGGTVCMYYTSRRSPNYHYYNTPCKAAVCGYTGQPPVQIPNIGVKFGTSHGTLPQTYDRLSNCSDGSTCYNVYCGTQSGLHMYRY
jgi:hypothetical protein